MFSNAPVRFVRSPTSSGSPNYSTINSILIAKTSAAPDLPGKRLNFEEMVQSQFLNESMMQSARVEPQVTVTVKGNYNVKESLVALDRLENISKNFLNYFGTNGGIPKERMAELLQLAHRNDSHGAPEASRENV